MGDFNFTCIHFADMLQFVYIECLKYRLLKAEINRMRI